VRAVLDANVIIAAMLSGSGSPAEILRACNRGEFELLVSEALLDELARALAYPKLRRRVSIAEADAAVRWVRGSATIVSDAPSPPPIRSEDPGDDYLIALASSERAALVSGDKHLLSLASELPIFSPADFLRLLEDRR
jgi:putative PIN family toxin of toxin-antitoxin system